MRWRGLKQTVYEDQPATQEDTMNRLVTTCTAINSETIGRSLQSVIARFKRCMIVQEHYFEYLRR